MTSLILRPLDYFELCPLPLADMTNAGDGADPGQLQEVTSPQWMRFQRPPEVAHGFHTTMKIRQYEVDPMPPADILLASNSVVERYGNAVVQLIKPLITPHARQHLAAVSAQCELDLKETAEVISFELKQHEGLQPLGNSYWRSARPSPGFETAFRGWDECKECPLVVVFVRPGSLDLGDFETSGPIIRSRAGTIAAYRLLARLQDEKRAAFGILTDELASVVMDSKFAMATTRIMVRFLVGAYLRYGLGCFGHWPSLTDYMRPYRGALPPPGSYPCMQDTSSLLSHPHVFDLYTVQRRGDALRSFHHWKNLATRLVLDHPLLPGTKLPFIQNGLFSELADKSPQDFVVLRPWTVPPRYDFTPLPPDTQRIVQRNPRPKNASVVQILNQTSPLYIEIVQVIRGNKRAWSQVFLVRLEGCDEELCLKLFDERLFDTSLYQAASGTEVDEPVSDMSEYYWEVSEENLFLRELRHADDLIERELSAYDSLQAYQGTLLPHCYGHHLVRLPRIGEAKEYLCYGILMEYIPGCTLGQLHVDSLPMEHREDIILRIKHGARALALSSVIQNDWHASQVIVKKPQGDDEHYDVIFIDFAFAGVQHDDDNNLDRLIKSNSMLDYVVSTLFDTEILKRCWGDVQDILRDTRLSHLVDEFKLE